MGGIEYPSWFIENPRRRLFGRIVAPIPFLFMYYMAFANLHRRHQDWNSYSSVLDFGIPTVFILVHIAYYYDFGPKANRTTRFLAKLGMVLLVIVILMIPWLDH